MLYLPKITIRNTRVKKAANIIPKGPKSKLLLSLLAPSIILGSFDIIEKAGTYYIEYYS